MKRLTHDEIIAAHERPNATSVIVASPFTKISVKYPNSAWFILTLDHSSGVFSLASDWGNYIHRWNLMGLDVGETFVQFILERADADYICDKVMSRDVRWEIDRDKTNETLEEELRGVFTEGDHSFDEDDLESDVAQLTEWTTAEELLQLSFYLLEEHEVSDCIREVESFRAAILRKLIVPTYKGVWAAHKAQQERVAAEKAELDAKYPQHAKFREVDVESRRIGEFIDFLDEKHYIDQHAPVAKTLIGEFYEIDVEEFDRETARMYKELP